MAMLKRFLDKYLQNKWHILGQWRHYDSKLVATPKLVEIYHLGGCWSDDGFEMLGQRFARHGDQSRAQTPE